LLISGLIGRTDLDDDDDDADEDDAEADADDAGEVGR
jgi:hypothetical protein